MKLNKILLLGFVPATTFGPMIGCFIGLYISSVHQESTNNEWRKAAAPIFAARGVPGLASTAEPADLRKALDVNSAMTHYEHAKLSPYWRHVGTKIMIVQRN